MTGAARTRVDILCGVLDELLALQSGVLTRHQALTGGLTPDAIRARLAAGHWRRLYNGVYASFTGPPSRIAALWAAVLRAGRGAVLSHATAAELTGLLDEPAPAIHVTIPAARRVGRISGVIVHVSDRVAGHPGRYPPRTRVEETVLDLASTCDSLDEAVGWLAKACGRRLTTAGRLEQAVRRRPRVRWRRELLAALEDVGQGTHSLLELRYLRAVERAHGLPSGVRQVVRSRPGGRYYDDVRYPDQHVQVELDGRAAHRELAAFRDFRRDNAAAQAGLTVLRYGWSDITRRPCEVAAQVAAILRRHGWRGTVRPCCPTCTVAGS
jgi:very-short-patch-repair endonuclease